MADDTKPPKEGVETKLSALALDTNPSTSTSTKPAKKKAKKVVADSWEDEDVSDESESETIQEPPTPTLAGTSAPPPTPISPPPAVRQAAYQQSETWPDPTRGAGRGDDQTAAKRPEKTDAVARRMIAAGLGLKAPKLTDEQKAYQKSVREQEKKKRELEKAEEQKRKDDAEKAKAAIWDD